MRKRLIAAAAALGLSALSLSSTAASPGDLLPPGAEEAEVYVWDGTIWTSLGTGDAFAVARSWNSGPDSSGGYSNQQHHTITFTNHASIAQWIDWEISGTRKDWRIRQPGVYASDSLAFRIKSNNAVTVDFEEFADLEDVDAASAPPGTETTIPTWYSYGDSIAEAEANGWVRAADLNEADFTFANSNPLHYNLNYTLWSKVEVRDGHNSSEYENVGRITLTLTNMKHWIDPVTGHFAEIQN